MVPEAGIEPARPYERGILSPKGKSIRLHLLIGFLVRNQEQITALKANVCACKKIIADRKNPQGAASFHTRPTNFRASAYADSAYRHHSFHGVLPTEHHPPNCYAFLHPRRNPNAQL
jgi:hypothetical protein